MKSLAANRHRNTQQIFGSLKTYTKFGGIVAEVFQPKRLVKVAQHLAGDWKLFAAKLKFPQSSIDNFEANAYTQEDRAMAMLTRYRYV